MKQLLEKIQKVSQKLKSIEKDMQVGKGNYAYKAVSDLSVVLKVKEAENEVKIISIPFKQDLVSSEIVRNKKVSDNQTESTESIVYVDVIKMTVRIYDLESEAYLDVESFGRGLDSSDKGFGKASTYARKYAILNAYKIATGEDPDSEASEKQQTITQKDKNVIVVNYLNGNVEYTNSILKHFGVGSMDDLNDTQIAKVYDSLSKKKLI
jgi:hypothetical protein